MHLQRLTLTPQSISKLPKHERALLCVLGHALNEINVLSKLFLIAGVFETTPRVIGHAQVCQAMVLGRALTGKLHETWKVLQRGFFKTKISVTYEPRLPKEPAADLSSLKAYFGKKNVVSTIRNSFAFHYSLKDAGAELPPEVPPEELSIYFGDTNGNSLYQFAEYAMGKALLDAINPTDSHAAFDQLISETSDVVSWFNGVAQGILFEIMEEHMGISAKVEDLEQIDIGEVARASDLKLPFFQEHRLRPSPTGDALPGVPAD